jgi:hypothetical protein
MTFRVVVATPERFCILDVGLVLLDSVFNSWERIGIQTARIQAAKFLKVALGVGDDEAVAKVALAFFDREFTVNANKGKTHETAWNTLALDIENRNGRFVVRRSACRLELPVAPIDLEFLSRMLETTRREE